jgi:probable phosphoglycerate mutase
MKIYLVRHGETEMNKQGLVNGWIDEPLIEEGIKQAEAVRDMLPGDIMRIYASSLMRTRQTADVINQRFQVPVSYHDELKERNWGKLAGMTFEEMEKKYGPQYSRDRDYGLAYDYRPFGGESIEDVRKRLYKVIDIIKEEAATVPKLLVAHAGIIRVLENDYNKKHMDEIPNTYLLEMDI